MSHRVSSETAPDFSQLFHSRVAGVVSWDREGRIVDANEAFRAMIGRRPGEELPRWSDVVPEDALPPAAAPFDVVRSDGKRMTLFVDAVSVATDDAPGLAVVIDLTPQRLAEEALVAARTVLERTAAEPLGPPPPAETSADVRRLRTDLEAERRAVELLAARLANANRELEAFSYSVSHDLRTPLRSIDGFSRALLSLYGDLLDDRGRDYLNRVRAAAQRMSRLIDDLLKLARVSRTAIRPVAVNLSVEVRQILEEMQKNEPERDVTWVVEPDLFVEGDRNLLRVALENLLSNAWKFTSKRESARIEVGRTWTEDGPVFFVRDNGAGFDPQYADSLFGAFQRLHTLGEFEGTGIGLATVRRIIHLHDGEICAESAVDRGATFSFTIGRRLSRPAHSPPSLEEPHDLENSPSRRQPR